jgi:hypothetical protein
MLVASTLPKMPFGIRLFHALNTHAHEAELLAVTTSEKKLPLEFLRTLLTGGRGDASVIHRHVFEKTLIKPNTEIEYSLDGDLLEPTNQPIEICLGPRFVFCSPYGNVL